MKTCKNCGASINDDSRFCTQCGADTFADGAGEQTAVLTEASAQPATDSNVSGGECYQPATGQTAASDRSGEVYYQPAGGTTESGTVSSYTYAAPADQVPVGNAKKGKGRVWAIIAAVVVILGIVGFVALGLFGENDDKPSSISKGYETSTAYINSSIDLMIDTSKGDMELMSDEYKNYYGVSEDDFETFICDMDTGDYIFIDIFEGTFYETSQDMKDFTKETMEYWYGEDESLVIGDVYEREIGGKTYTCADVSQTKSDYSNNVYAWDTATCFLREGSTFFEIEITVYPDESTNTIDSIISTYFSEYGE